MNENMIFAPVLPELYVSNIDRSLQFYTKILGFQVLYERDKPRFAFLSLQERAQLMLQQLEAGDEWITGALVYPFGRGVNFQIDIAEVEGLAGVLAAHGIELIRGLKDSWYRGGDTLFGCRELIVRDPDGYMLRFSQSLGRRLSNARQESAHDRLRFT